MDSFCELRFINIVFEKKSSGLQEKTAHNGSSMEDPGLNPHPNLSSHFQDFINSFEKKAAFIYSPNYQIFEVGYQEHGN